MKTKKVIVVDYDDKWSLNFQEIEKELKEALGDIALKIEHVGSTSVINLAAKPIIDIDVVIDSISDLYNAIDKLAKIDYIFEGDLGIKDRYAFRYENKSHLQTHHLYVCPKNSQELIRHLSFRDYLRNNPEDVIEYSKVKKEGARLYLNDIDKYIEYKSLWINNIYNKCGIK